MNPYSRLSAAILKNQPATAARVLENFPPESVARLLAAASTATAAQVIGRCTPGFAAGCLAVLAPASAARIFDQLMPDDQVTLLRQLEQPARDALLREMQPESAATVQRLLPWPDGTAGALMEATLTSVPEELSVREALKRIKRIRRGMKSYLYATSATGRLTGVLTLHELLTALPTRTVSQIMRRRVATLSPRMSIQAVLDSPYWQEYHALPVTDGNDVLLGVIRQKHLRRFAEQAVHTDMLGGSLGVALATCEQFSLTAIQLVSAVITAFTLPARRSPR